jgi:crossover junction endodeoxyribonuclease RusA
VTRIELPFPVPLHACFTNVPGRGRVPTGRYKAWQNEALWMIKAQRVQPIKGEVSISVGLVAPDKRQGRGEYFSRPRSARQARSGCWQL